MELNLKRNIRTYILYSTFSNMLIIGPVIMIFLKMKGLSFTEIMLINSISSLSVFLFEVPTGLIADKTSRKFSVIIGTFLLMLGLAVITFLNSFFLVALGEMIFALGAAFRSGADMALIYDTLKATKKEKEFQRIEGRAKSALYYGQAIGCIASSLLYEINMYIPFVISIGFVFCAMITALFFKEPPIHEKHESHGDSYFTQMKKSSKYVLTHSKLKALFFHGAVFYFFYRISFFFYQPYFEGVDIPVKYYGIFFAIFNIVAGMCSNKSHIIMEKTKGKTLMILSSLLICSLLLMGVTHMWIGTVFILLQQMARALYRPVIFKHLNKNIPSNKRATILSLYSLVINIFLGVFTPLTGVLGDTFNVFTCHLILGGIMLTLTILSLNYLKGVQQKSKNTNTDIKV